ncbi:MAG TPA: NAD(P)/FAD-dependent oxidoreductase [Candidatus Angelobacter sp.]|nr:NAD(P)/FAD-dependent oxidoreductase [Candidatus Angelobacter sp.]
MSRRFRGLREDPERRYDCVIIGAGVGGLLTANLLGRSGLKVLLVEQHFMVGGYCSTFRRGGYTFDAATHFYPLLGNPATMTGALLAELDVTTEWVKMDPVDSFHFPDGSRFTVPAKFDIYLARLKEEFPEESANIDRFFTLVRKTYLLGLMHYFRQVDTKRIAPYQHLTIRDVLNKYFRSEKLKLVLTGDIGHWGSPPSKTSFVFDSMLRLAYFLGNYYPRGGSQVFVDELAQRFEEAGGHILMNSTVKRILVRNNTAVGVEIETGSARKRLLKQVMAGIVISNADLRLTLEGMIGAEFIDPVYLATVREMRPTHACFLTHLGLKNISLDELRRAEGYHWSSWDSENVATHAFKVFLPTGYDPSLAPPGGQIIIVQKLTEIDYGSMQDWAMHKAGVEAYIMSSLEKCLPGIGGKVAVRLSATAQTSHRYTLNHHGAMLGWAMSPDQLGEKRPDIQSPFRNLYFIGHWTRPGGGITPVMISAMQAVKLILGGEPQAGLPIEVDHLAPETKEVLPRL